MICLCVKLNFQHFTNLAYLYLQLWRCAYHGTSIHANNDSCFYVRFVRKKLLIRFCLASGCHSDGHNCASSWCWTNVITVLRHAYSTQSTCYTCITNNTHLKLDSSVSVDRRFGISLTLSQISYCVQTSNTWLATLLSIITARIICR